MIPQQIQRLGSDYAYRLRTQPNPFIVASLQTKEEDIDLDDSGSLILTEGEDSDDHTRPRRAFQKALQSIEATKYTPPRRRQLKRTNYLLYNYALEETKKLEMEVLPEQLVPIKIELDLEGFKLRDSFLWNLQERFFTPEKFAEIMCDDVDLSQKYVSVIALSIKNQLEDYLESKVQTLQIEDSVTIELELMVGRTLIRDKFEWDLNGELTPEEFAHVTCSELGLQKDHVPLFAAALREQILRICQTQNFTPAIVKQRTSNSVVMNPRDEWAPIIEELDSVQAERYLDRDKRETRRARRVASRSSYSRLKMQEIGNVLENTRKLEESLYVEFTTKTAIRNSQQKQQQTRIQLSAVQQYLQQHLHIHGTPILQDDKPIKLQRKTHNNELCTHCGLDSSRTLCFKESNGKTLCNLCGIRFELDTQLPESRKNMFL